MVGIDTNVLVRFVTRDDEKQWSRVEKYLNACCSEQHPGWISSIVLCEFIWVLSSGYGYRKADIVRLLDQLLVVSSLEFETKESVREAVNEYRDGPADFSDYLIAAHNKANGCRKTVTLDKRAAKHPGFELL